ncbi:hypothetical protein [Rickettsia slovaca]|nr:hypothetical protein [Rickettsia slovaca]
MVIAVIYSVTKEEIIQKYPYMFGAFLWLLTVPMVAYLKIIDVNCLALGMDGILGITRFYYFWGAVL